MTDLVVYHPTDLAADRIGFIVAAWLDAKRGRSGSERTARIYRDALQTFRGGLLASSLDLDGDGEQIANFAQGFAGRGDVAASTHNHRLAVLSSFYTFATRRDRKLFTANPIDMVERRKVEGYSGVAPLDAGAVQAALAKVGTELAIDKRDRALLTYALTTGRRLAEVADLTWGDVLVNGTDVTVITRRAKGGKVMRDKLAKRVAAALLTWREAALLLTGNLDATSPVWFAIGRRTRPLTDRAIELIAERRLDTGHFHQLRHTFAVTLESAGAKVSDVQARLGHASLQTTSRYLAGLRSDVNPYADAVADALIG